MELLKIFIKIFKICSTIFLIYPFNLYASSEEEKYKYLDLFGQVFDRVRSSYVEEVSDQELIEKAIDGMLSGLDPHSGYMNEDVWKEMQMDTKGKFGGLGIEITMTWLAIIGTILLLITFLTTKERIVPDPEEKTSLIDDLKDLIKNIPWVIMLTVTILQFTTLAMKGGAYVYYFENYVSKNSLSDFISPILDFLSNIGINFFGNDAVSAGFGLFNAGGIIFMIIGIGLSKILADKYGKRNVFGVFLFISTLFIIAFYFLSKDAINLIFGAQILHGFFYGITIPLLWAMIADVADYSEWRNNRRATAIIFSAMMVGLKLGLSIGGALVAQILGNYGYVPNNVGEQTESAILGTKMLVSIFPSIPFLVAAALLFFYVIDKNMEEEIEQDLLKKRKS